MAAMGYNNHLKWNEQAMFKGRPYERPPALARCRPQRPLSKLEGEGMRAEDITMLDDWVRKAQASRRLIPQRNYRSFVFSPPLEVRDSGSHVGSVPGS